MSFEVVIDKIEKASRRSGRNASEIFLLPVSKGQIVETIVEQLNKPGFPLRLGENYLQELSNKKLKLNSSYNIEWHYLGALQSRKIEEIFRTTQVVHSISRFKELEILSRLDLKQNTRFYLQFNVSREVSKGGFSLNDVRAVREKVEELKLISNVEGLMTLASSAEHVNEKELRAQFSYLRNARDMHFKGLGLSMGMSLDFEVAIEEGATCVRVGSAIFGARK